MQHIAMHITLHSYGRYGHCVRFYGPGTAGWCVVWLFTIVRHSHKRTQLLAEQVLIITGTDLNAGTYPHPAQVHATRKRDSGRQRQELATVVWRLLRFLLLGGGMA
jgi:hypothetical protein